MPKTAAFACLLLLFAVLVAPAARAQMPRFQTRPASASTPYKGTLTFRIAANGYRIGPKASVGVRILTDGRPHSPEACDRLPYTFTWDSAKVFDGWHAIQVVLTDRETSRETVADQINLRIENDNPAPTPEQTPDFAVRRRRGSNSTASGATRQETPEYPHWQTRETDETRRPVWGIISIRLGADPAGATRPENQCFAVRVAGTRKLNVWGNLPTTFVWDTTEEPDGPQTLQLLLIDLDSDREVIVDEVRVIVDNAGSHNRRDASSRFSVQRPTGGRLVPQGAAKARNESAQGASGVWWHQNGVIYRGKARGMATATDAFLPWNGAGRSVAGLTVDEDGVWVASASGGVRRIDLNGPSPADGYNGYVRARLGAAHAAPPANATDKKLAVLVEEWQGVPYDFGGESKSGTDCSGFVGALHRALGKTIARNSQAIGRDTRGALVRDELRYGDVLVYPPAANGIGHVALYIGNGRTAETTGNQVGKGSIWSRTEVTVRRFLHKGYVSPQLLAAGAVTGDRKTRFQGIAALARAIGDPHPLVAAAQWALESNWGRSQSGKNNFFGIKARGGQAGTDRWTKEFMHGSLVDTIATFADYATAREGVAARLGLLKGGRYARYHQAKTAQNAAHALQACGYATDPHYAAKLIGILRRMNIAPSAARQQVAASQR